jgi:hypothetical protein
MACLRRALAVVLEMKHDEVQRLLEAGRAHRGFTALSTCARWKCIRVAISRKKCVGYVSRIGLRPRVHATEVELYR